MKLSRIYSNKEDFKLIDFSSGLNVIVGGKEQDVGDIEVAKVLEHNLGKTSLSFLIDFLLLKKYHQDGFIEKYSSDLVGWVFYLELELNNKKYLTIKRGVDSPNKVSFKFHENGKQVFVNETLWDEEDITVGSRKEDPKEILQNKYLGLNVCQSTNFRHFLGYTLRTQDDYQDVFRLNLFRGADINWKPQLFGLLGFDGFLIKRKYELEDEIKLLKGKLSQIGFSPKKDSLDKINAAIRAKTNERDEMGQKIKALDFFDADKTTSENAVDIVLDKIAKLNSEEYRINYNIQQINKTVTEGIAESIDLSSITSLFNEVQLYFPDNLKHELEEVVNFSKSITAERNKFLLDELNILEQKKKEISAELHNLNKDWTNKVGRLMEKDKFSKYDSYRNDISRLDAEIIFLNNKIEEYKKYEEIKKEIDKSKSYLEDIIRDINDIVNLGGSRSGIYGTIQGMFSEIFNKIFEGTALLFMEQNQKGNIEFKTEVQNNITVSSGQGDGWTATKIQCISFTLALLATYSSSSFLRFAYLDGLLEGLADKHKIHCINIIKEYCAKYNLQFIITVIRSDIPLGYSFEESEIKRTLHKGGGELFGKTF